MIEPRRALRLREGAGRGRASDARRVPRARARDRRLSAAWARSWCATAPTSGLRNRSFLIAPDGAHRRSATTRSTCSTWRSTGGESYRESAAFRPGEAAALAPLPWGVLGMSVCYDLRFPHLYRALAQAGAQFLSVPSAFTVPTGRAHWHVLLRARAIENFCFVFAPAQCGEHAEGRRTYGHSLIVAPWGEILAEAGDDGRVHPRRDRSGDRSRRRAAPCRRWATTGPSPRRRNRRNAPPGDGQARRGSRP